LRKHLLAYIFASTYLHIMETRRDAFHAIADPTRRQILDILVDQPLTLNAIADNFDVTRQAVSLHVKILEECGLLVITKQGRERVCEAHIETLTEVSDWIDNHRQLWTRKFKSLDKYLEKIQKTKKGKK
jgi:DNA-binding transcriptional ArsR family regulator